MPVSYVAGAAAVVATTADLFVAVPTPAGAGGRLYAFGNVSAALTITPPAGWTELFNLADAVARVYGWMRADDAAGSYVFTASGGFNSLGASVHRLAGASTNVPVFAVITGPNDQNQTCPTIITPSANCLVFWASYFPSARGPASANKGTERVDQDSIVGAVFQAVYTNLEAVAGSIIGATITTVGFGEKRLISLAVESAPTPVVAAAGDIDSTLGLESSAAITSNNPTLGGFLGH